MEDVTTQIDKNSNFEGRLGGKDARIQGRFKGEIQLTGRLMVGDEARVEGKIVSDAAEIAGEFRGEIFARSVVLLDKARVEGVVEAQSLSVREGAQLNATVNAGRGVVTRAAGNK